MKVEHILEVLENESLRKVIGPNKHGIREHFWTLRPVNGEIRYFYIYVNFVRVMNIGGYYGLEMTLGQRKQEMYTEL
jgi:hypothetical protein